MAVIAYFFHWDEKHLYDLDAEDRKMWIDQINKIHNIIFRKK